MAGRRLAMSKQTEILRLKGLGLRDRAIARALSCSRNTVKKYLAGDEQNYNPPFTQPQWITDFDWNEAHREYLQGVPLNVLWEEKVEDGKVPVQYPGFWKQFIKKFPNTKDATMVRHFSPGARVEIDYCDGIDILDVSTGEVLSTQLFAGVLCHSRYLFAEFTFSQKSCDFLSSHVRMFEAFGGVPATVTPDNLKSAVTKAHRYDPEKNPAYARLAEHYNIVVTPARVRTPKDKPIVERTIQIFQKWFYYRVRKRTFTSLVELNQSLQEHIKVFHKKKHRVLMQTRDEMFEVEKEHLSPLPEVSYEVAIHKKATLSIDCHLQFDKNYYSAPWTLRGKKLDVWATDKSVEIWHAGERVAFHSRCYLQGRFRTDKKHYPPQHQAYLEITPCYLRKKAKEIGENTFQVIDQLFKTKFPLQYLRRAQGIVALAKKYSAKELDSACQKALYFDKYYVQFIEGLIKNVATAVESKKVKRLPNPLLRGDELYQ
jgi:transposase